ncbi:MAG: winged helix-turn-helix transcriptional regulator [Clostridiales bacterium]|jgi:DNA-binding MarR family transcriptional regulator|nr:winged helix-turn-helix transcriptional regulator [Clostridiales bacterium]
MEDKIKQIETLFLEFLPLYHQNFGVVFRDQDGLSTRCTKNQKRAILLIKKRQGVTSSELGQCLDMRKGSLTTLLDSLESMGLVERCPDVIDRRRTQLYLTPDGETYFDRMMARHGQLFHSLFSALSDDDLDKCLTGMADIVTIMKKLQQEAPHGIHKTT